MLELRMEMGEFFLIFALILLLFDLIQLSKAKPLKERKSDLGFYAATLACGLIAASYLLLVQAFLNDNFSLKEVYSSSSSSLPVISKVYATWSGAGGSILLLTFLIGILYFAYRFRTYEKRSSSCTNTSTILNFILIFFIVLTVIKNPFEKLPATVIEGSGLIPQLQTFWMSIHPPIVFSGYVFVLLAFALTLANMKTGERAEARLFKLSIQAAWLLLTLGIASGGLWAYEVLGWGGCWAWDPVETASLLPWLALTAYLHLAPLTKNKKSLARELMILITFAAMMFLSALARGGLRESVHAYALSPAGPVFLLLALGMTVYFFYLKGKIKKPLFYLEFEKSSIYFMSVFIGYTSLMIIFLVCFVGVAFPIIGGIFLEYPPPISTDFYNNWNFPFVMAFVAALIGYSIYERIDLKKLIGLVAGVLTVGTVLVQLKWPTPNAVANLGIPLLIVALLATTYSLVRVLPKKKRSLRLFGKRLLHFAIILILIGVFISSTTKQVTTISNAKPNTTMEELGLRIELKNLTVYTGTGTVQLGETLYPEYSALKLDLVINQGGSTYSSALWIRLYKAYGIVSTPLIIPTLTGDIYIHMYPTESIRNALAQALMGEEVLPEDLVFTVEIVPMVYLVWAGVTLLAVGMAILLIKELVSPTKSVSNM